MDIVYPLKQGAGEEIIYSLRSLKNVPHGKVFVAGWFPPFLNPKTVLHIPTVQNLTKYKNAGFNIRAAIADERVSEKFILFNDDFFVLKKVTDPEQELNLCLGKAEDFLYKMFINFKTFSPYMSGLWQTCFHLKKRGIAEPLCYELHIPFVYDKQKLQFIYDLPEKKEINVFHTRTAYGNLFLKNSVIQDDVKVLDNRVFNEDKKNGKFLSCSDSGFKKIKEFLNDKFPEKSVYEM